MSEKQKSISEIIEEYSQCADKEADKIKISLHFGPSPIEGMIKTAAAIHKAKEMNRYFLMFKPEPARNK